LQNKFRLALIALTTSAFISCHNSKEVQTETTATVETEKDSVSTNDGSVGIVMFYSGVIKDMSANDGCGFMIVVPGANGQDILLEPDQLDEAYKIDGKAIEFTYTDSRRQTKCTVPSKPITMGEIKK
jgi:hypothetical protein